MIDLLAISHACFMGINRNIYSLLLKNGWKVEVVVPQVLHFPAGDREAEAPGPLDPPIHYLMLQGENPRIYQFTGLMNLLKEKKPSVVLLDNDPVSRLALMVGKWCKKNNAKLFCISCENLPLTIPATIKRRGLRSLPAAFFKRVVLHRTKKVVHGIFTLNSDGKKIFIEEGYTRVERMPLGFDPSYFFINEEIRKKIRNDLGLTKSAIAYFGRLTPEKGVHLLIKALETLKQYEWQLMMDDFDEYASGYNKEIHRLIKDAGISERVVYINPSHEEIAGYMNAADVVVVPSISSASWKEQYGRVAAESMACGKLVIASDSGSLPELLGGHGLLFSEGDILQLSKRLEFFLTGSTGEIPSPAQISTYATRQLSIQKQCEVMQAQFKS